VVVIVIVIDVVNLNIFSLYPANATYMVVPEKNFGLHG